MTPNQPGLTARAWPCSVWPKCLRPISFGAHHAPGRVSAIRRTRLRGPVKSPPQAGRNRHLRPVQTRSLVSFRFPLPVVCGRVEVGVRLVAAMVAEKKT